MPTRRQDIEFEAASEHLKRQATLAWPVACLPPLGLQVLTLDWHRDPGNLLFAALLSGVAGAVATIAAVLIGFGFRLSTRDRGRVRLSCRLACVLGFGLVLASLVATGNSPRNALDLPEERLVPLLVVGTLLLALGVANLPRPERPGRESA